MVLLSGSLVLPIIIIIIINLFLWRNVMRRQPERTRVIHTQTRTNEKSAETLQQGVSRYHTERNITSGLTQCDSLRLLEISESLQTEILPQWRPWRERTVLGRMDWHETKENLGVSDWELGRPIMCVEEE